MSAVNEIKKLKQERDLYRRFTDFANKWCNRESKKLSASERIDVIKHHPIAQERLKELAALSTVAGEEKR